MRTLKCDRVARLAVLLAFWLSGGLLHAQRDTGTIIGAVLDGTGAGVPGAAVTVTNSLTNVKITITTDANGDYIASPLRIGTYRVEAEIAGFKKTVEDGVVLRVQDRLRIDLHLEVGAVTERVEVTAVETLLQTQTSSLGQVFETKQVHDLPLNGRSYIQLITLTAGAFVPQKMNTIWPDAFVAINGNRAHENTYLLDGVNNNTSDNNNPAIIPPPDAIAEFKVSTNSLAAEFGRAAGGAINVVIKSGTNQFHGNLFAFHRRDSLDANAFFNSGRPKPHFRQNQFGGTFGGPIKQNRTFFFVDYQRTAIRQARADVGSVPNPDERAGDFSRVANLIFDPLTSRPNPAGSGFIRDPFPGNIIPDARISSAAKRVLGLFPAPNVPGARTNNFIGNSPLRTDTHEFDVRVDHQQSAQDSFFARGSAVFRETLNPGVLWTPATPSGGGSRTPGGLTPGRGAAAGYTHVFSPRLVNEVRAGFARLYWFLNVWDPSIFGGALLGIPGIPATSPGWPAFNITGWTSWADAGPNTRGKNVFHYFDNLSYTRGKHSLKMGVESRFVQFNLNQGGGARGSFSFNGVFTQQPFSPTGTGYGPADFLLGYANTASIAVSTGTGERIRTFSGFLMDDWKATNRLTLNLGVRYDLVTPPFEVRDRERSFDLNKGVLVFAKPGSWRDRAFNDLKKNDFAPRIGLAYTLTPKTVIRSAYGMFWAYEDNLSGLGAGGYPWAISAVYPSDQINPSSAINLDRGVPPNWIQFSPTAPPNLGVRGIDNFKPAYIQQWNFTLEREIGSVLLGASYVGNKGTKLARYLQRNQPLPGPGNINDRRPYPGYGTVSMVESSGNSIYHGLLLKAEKRFSRGLSFLASYTFSKAIEDSGSPALDSTSAGSDQPQDPRNLRAERGLSPHDVRNRFIVSYTYELPFGKGRPYMSNASKLAETVLGGWQVNGITVLQSGRHETIGVSFDASNTGSSNYRANALRSPDLPSSQRTVSRYFDTSAFAIPAPYTYGNAGRNTVEGPGQVNFDFSLFKNFRLRERAGNFGNNEIQFRAEFFNLLNTPQFQIPNRLVGTPQFGSITDVVNYGRQIQLALKFRF